MKISAVGDIYLAQRVDNVPCPDFAAVVSRLRDAQVRFGNLEMLLYDCEEGAAAQAGGAWAAAPTRLANQIKWLGMDVVSIAHNHAGDYGPPGLRATHRSLSVLGIKCVGAGECLEEARAPVTVRGGDREVAVIAATSTFMDHARAGRRRPGSCGRAGISPLRFETRYRVDGAVFEALKRFSEALPVSPEAGHRETALGRRPLWDNDLNILGNRFARGDEFAIESWCHPWDLEEITQQIDRARRHCSSVLVSIHSHEYDQQREIPPGFLVQFCRACIDAGADAVIGHGPHILRGIEIYKNKPIFYSLGAFIFQPYRFPQQPADFFEAYGLDPQGSVKAAYDIRRARAGFFDRREFWEAAMVVWSPGRENNGIDIYPIDLWAEGVEEVGLPHVPEPAAAKRILQRLSALSATLGTEVRVDGSAGAARISW